MGCTSLILAMGFWRAKDWYWDWEPRSLPLTCTPLTAFRLDSARHLRIKCPSGNEMPSAWHFISRDSRVDQIHRRQARLLACPPLAIETPTTARAHAYQLSFSGGDNDLSHAPCSPHEMLTFHVSQTLPVLQNLTCSHDNPVASSQHKNVPVEFERIHA